MCAVPCVVQSFTTKDSPYDFLPDDVCIKADDVIEWKQAVEKLIADKKLRRELGMKAKKYVLENYNIQTNYKQWVSFYDSLLN
jgi:glycosyltransferase involved in cell wall biosynthesis